MCADDGRRWQLSLRPFARWVAETMVLYPSVCSLGDNPHTKPADPRLHFHADTPTSSFGCEQCCRAI